jgi:hypothetical protein
LSSLLSPTVPQLKITLAGAASGVGRYEETVELLNLNKMMTEEIRAEQKTLEAAKYCTLANECGCECGRCTMG